MIFCIKYVIHKHRHGKIFERCADGTLVFFMNSIGGKGSRAADRLSRFKPVAIVLIAALLTGLLAGLESFTDGMEQTALSYNILASYEAPQYGQRAVIIMCTDNTVDKLSEDNGWPIDRGYYTHLLNNELSRSDLVVFDILFSSSSDDPQTDEEFARAIENHGRVVLSRSNTEVPVNTLIDSGARIGYALEFDEHDNDAVSRRYKLFLGNDTYSGITLICAALTEQGYRISFDGKSTYTVVSPEGGSRTLRVDEDGYFYRIPVKRGIDVQIIDLYDVLNGNYSESLFDGAAVFIGGTVAGNEDIVHSPDFAVSDDEVTGEVSTRVIGTKFLVDSYYTVLRGFSPQVVSVFAKAVLSVALFLLTAFFSLKLPAKFGWLAVPVLGVGWFALTRLLFVLGLYYLPLVMHEICIIISYLLCLMLRLLHTSREWQVSSLPIETLYRMTYGFDDAEKCDTFEEYINNFSGDVFGTLHVKIIEAQVGRSEQLEDIIPEKANGTRVIKNRMLAEKFGASTLIVIPLPAFGDFEDMFTVLGAEHTPSSNWIQSVTALILSMYVYYKVIKQSAEKQEAAMSMIKVIIQMIDAKDPVTAGHSRRVSKYSRKIAEWLGYDKKRASDLEFAALLHDIGKIGVEDAVLNKPGFFTRADYEKMKSHPTLGAEIVRTVGLSEEIADGVLNHHERMDGRGYPGGVPGEKCSEFARIIKVADVYDALICKRQYKSAWDERRAFDVIYNGMGTEFDERIARTFIENAAPADYVPGTESEGSRLPDSAAMRKAVSFARELWNSCGSAAESRMSETSEYKGSFNFDCARGFADMEWGEKFSSAESLSSLPVILSYVPEDESIVSALRGKELVKSILMYYHKGCLSAGLVTLNGRENVDNRLSEIYPAAEKSDGCTVRCSPGCIVVEFSANEVDIICYVTAYLANEL